MKRIGTSILMLLFLSLGGLLQAQSAKDVFANTDTPLFYLGIDFTRARLIDDAGANEIDIRNRLYTEINQVVVNEPKKYDIKGAFHKSYVDHDLGPVNTRNEKTNAADIKSSNTGDFHRFKESDVVSVVKSFDFGDKKGVGLLFVVEAMSKSEKAAAIWVTLVDMKAKKVLMTERMESKVSMAFGFRNYWASPFKNLLDTIEKRKYNEWRSKYGA